MPDPDRPSSAPLTDADADRLSERFTASWDEPAPWGGAAVSPPSPAPVPASPGTTTAKLAAVATPPVGAPTPPTADPAAPAPAAVPTNPPLAKPKQTLLGIAPILPIGPSHPAPAIVATPAAAPSTTPPAAASTAPPPELSSSPTTAVTTPSKPYIPKDHPSTPAVVISDAALTEPFVKEDRSRTAQTMPGQTRSTPNAAPAPVPLVLSPLVAPTAPVAPAASTLDDTYPPLRRRGSKLPLLVGGAALLAAVAVVGLKLTAGPSTSADQSAASVTDQPTAPPPAPAETSKVAAAEAPPPPTPSEPVATAAPPEPVAAAAPEAPVSKKSKSKKPAAPTPAKRPGATRPEPKAEARPTPAAEPAATPTPKPAKGVIVRETPF